MTAPETSLRVLAKELGVQPTWRSRDGARHTIGDDTLLALVRSLGTGVDALRDAPDALARLRAEVAREIVPPVVVLWDGAPLRLPLRLRSADPVATFALTLAPLGDPDAQELRWTRRDTRIGMTRRLPDGSIAVTIDAPGRIPFGLYALHLSLGGLDAHASVVAAPGRLPESPASDRRRWGLRVGFDALDVEHRTRSGNLAALEHLATWAAALGARVIATEPMLASFGGFGSEPNGDSAPLPASRRFWHEAHVDLDALDRNGTPLARDASPRAHLEHASAIAAGDPAREDALRAWLAKRPDVLHYAAFRAAVERTGPDAEPDAAALDDPLVRYHAYAQWTMDAQMTALATRLQSRQQALHLEVPGGAHPHGYDQYAAPDLFARGVTAGLPPDDDEPDGLDLGFLPVHPHASRASGHEHFLACLEHHLRVAPIVSLQHVGSLHRTWWIPAGAPPSEGAFVRAPADELYALLSLAANRHDALVVGHALGTVPSETDRAMQRHRLLAAWVAADEVGAGFEPPPRRVVATVDVAPAAEFRARWNELARAERRAVLDTMRAAAEFEPDDGDAHRAPIVEIAVPPDDADPDAVARALLRYTGASRAEIVLAEVTQADAPEALEPTLRELDGARRSSPV